MKFKRVISGVLVGMMSFLLVACGNTASGDASSAKSAKKDNKLVIWTLAKDLEQFADLYHEQTGVETEVVIIEPAEYLTKVQTAIVGGETEPDVIVGEPQMLGSMYESGFFANLDELGAKEFDGKIVDYVWEVGKDAEGVQRAISYQITPAGIYYRRDIAKEVFGVDDPDEVGKLFKDYPTILETANTLKSAGYRIFSSDSEMSYFSGDSAWVIDGKLNVDQSRIDFMDLAVQLYQDDLTAYAAQWSTPWYQAMAGEVPILSSEIQSGTDDSVNVWDAKTFAESTKDMEKTEVFAFGLPSWGVLSLRDNVGDTYGNWGVCAGPSSGFGGGTYLGISANSKRQDTAWDFIKFCTLNEETADWWIGTSEGDTVSLISALEKHAEDSNDVYGGQKLYKFWQEEATKIDYSKVTKYDTAINDAWGAAISSIKSGEMSKEDAINNFYDVVASTYPELVIEK